MNMDSTPPKKFYLILFLFFACIFTLFISPKPVGDGLGYYHQTRNLVENGELTIPMPGKDGQVVKGYSTHPDGQFLTAVPFYFVGKIVAGFYKGDQAAYFAICYFFVGFLNIIFISIGLCLLAYLVQLYTGNIKHAVLTSVLCGFATFYGCYSKYNFSEPAASVALLLMIIFLVRWHRETNPPGGRLILYSGLAISMAAFYRWELILLALPAISFVALLAPKNLIKNSITLFMGLFPILVFNLAGNFYKYGSFFDNPQTGTAFASSLSTSIIGHLFSPSKGIIYFVPLVLITVPSFYLLAKKRFRESMLIISTITLLFLVYSKWMMWAGDTAVGPRFVVIFTPLLMLPFAVFLSGLKNLGRLGPYAFSAASFLAIAGVVVFFLCCATDPLMIYDRAVRILTFENMTAHYFYWKPFTLFLDLIYQGKLFLTFADYSNSNLPMYFLLFPVLALVILFGAARWLYKNIYSGTNSLDKDSAGQPKNKLTGLLAPVSFFVFVGMMIVLSLAIPRGLSGQVTTLCRTGDDQGKDFNFNKRPFNLRVSAFDAFANPFLEYDSSCKDIKATMSGYLQIPVGGITHLYLSSTGLTKVNIDGVEVFDLKEPSHRGVTTFTTDFKKGWVPIQIDYERYAKETRMILGLTIRDGPIVREIISPKYLLQNRPDGIVSKNINLLSDVLWILLITSLLLWLYGLGRNYMRA